jgi:hypothetical protein
VRLTTTPPSVNRFSTTSTYHSPMILYGLLHYKGELSLMVKVIFLCTSDHTLHLGQAPLFLIFPILSVKMLIISELIR